MTPSSLLRSAAIAAFAFLLAGCNGSEQGLRSAKHLQPLSADTYKKLEDMGMRKEDPILIRIYKEESRLEVWKKRQKDGRYALFKTYDICRWSGTLGPKQKEGDKQAPEGFYTITPGLMNPNSSFYLSFNLGYPNAYDRAYGRTGMHLMVHGACSSAGCYSMTDQNIAEIYALAREAFNGGQKSFQVQALPFRMTAENLARHRSNPNMSFWKNLKEGTDSFEVTRLEPKVDVCGRKYVFNASPADPSMPLSAAMPCPEYNVPPEIATAVAAKAKADEIKVAALIQEGVAEAPLDVRQPDPNQKPSYPEIMVAEAGSPPAAAPTPTPTQVIAAAQPETRPSAGPVRSAMAFAAVPTPRPNPVRSSQLAALQSAPAASTGVLGRWFGGSSEETTGSVAKAPAASGQAGSAAQLLANTGVQAEAAADEKPFYKRMLPW